MANGQRFVNKGLEGIGSIAERHEWWCWAAFTLVYAAVTGHLAARRVLWSDEITNLLIACAPSWHAFWDSARHGPDTLPPLGHLAVRLTCFSAPWTELGARIPAIIGVWTGAFTTYLTLRKHGRVAAWCGALFLLSTLAYSYAFESRPYGLLVGFSGLAACFQQSTWTGSRRMRLASAAGLFVSLFSAVACHWFGILTFIACATIEAVAWRQGRSTPAARGALVCAAAALSLLYPFVLHAHEFSGIVPAVHISVSVGGMVQPLYGLIVLYSNLLGGTALALCLLLVVCAFSAPGTTRSRDIGGAESTVTTALVFSAIPVVGLALAIGGVGVLTDRYLLATVIGFGLGVGVAVSKLAGHRPTALGLCLTVALAGFAATAVRAKETIVETSAVVRAEGPYAVLGLAKAIPDPTLPILVPDLHVYLPLLQYGDESLRRRIWYVAGQNAQASFQMARYQPWFDVRFLTTEQALGLPRFIVYQAGDDFLSQLALSRGRRVEPLALNQSDPRTFPRPGFLVLVE